MNNIKLELCGYFDSNFGDDYMQKIVIHNMPEYDFYIDKYVGKRGGYVCFYPISDSVTFEKYEKGTKKALRQKYGNIRFYNYSQNIIKADKSIIVFANTNYFDAVIFEPDKDFSDMIRKAAEVSVKSTDENGESTQISEN